MTQRQKQKSLLIDPSNRLHFNVAHENIHMRKIKSSQGDNSNFHILLPPSPMSFGNNKLYYSVVQKESQSGISYNPRLFFLKDDDFFGYVSKADLNFQIENAKETVPLKSLRKIVPKGKILTLQFQVRPISQKESDKAVQKKWILRMKDKKMADAWTDIINYQLSQIPSRKSTVEKQQNFDETENKQEDYQNRNKKQEKKVKFQQPIANQRPQQDLIQIKKYESQLYSQQQNQIIQKYKNSDQNGQSPIRQQRSQDSDHIELSPGNLQDEPQRRSQQNFYNTVNSLKSGTFLLHSSSSQQRQFFQEKTFYEQIEQSFRIQNKKLKEKLYLPSFLNYFRPYIVTERKSKTFLLEIDKKYQDFITFCQLTSKQFIDIEHNPLYQFILSNRYIIQKQTQSKDKLLKQMTEMYEKVFRKPSSKSMDVESLLLLFENILYIQLQDVQIVVPLMQLKTLPMPTNNFSENYSSGNKICETSLINEFENMQYNLSYIYQRILNDKTLKQYYFIPMSCQIQYKGFNLFFRSKVNQNISKLNKILEQTLQIENASSLKKQQQKPQEENVENLYKKLGQILCVNPDLFQRQTHTKIIPLKNKIIDCTSEQTKTKYAFIFADILPYLSSDQILNSHIFSKVHNSSFLINYKKQILPLNKSVSQNSSRFKASSSIIPLASETKSISKVNRPLITQIPLYNHFVSIKQNDLQNQYYKEQINLQIKEVAQKFDRFDISVIHPVQIYQILQAHYLDHKNLGEIAQIISTKNSFVKSILKSQIAAQCVKIILFKKSQQLLLLESSQQQDRNKIQQNLTKTLTILLNLILGKYETKQTEMIWKVLTLHAQIIYGVSIFQKDIHKGYFILALVSKLNIIINPSSSNIQDIFTNDKFILAIKFQTCRPKPVQILSNLLQSINQQNLKKIVSKDDLEIESIINHLGLNDNPIPYFVKRSKSLNNKILLLLTRKISPTNLNFSHLNLFQTKSLNFTQIQGLFSIIENKRSNETASDLIKEKQLSLKRQSWEENFTMYLKKKLQQIQHKTTEKINFNFVKEIQSYIKQIKVFYQNHPFISKFLQFLSEYYVSKYDCQNGLECLKVSLANMISICQGNTNHCGLAKIYIKRGIVYEKIRKYQQALNNYKRSKHCLQANKSDNTELYALSLIKLSKITLQNDNNISETLNYAIQASKSLQSMEKIHLNVSLLIQAYEIEAKCLRGQNLENIRISQPIDFSSRPQHYFDLLEKALLQQSLRNIGNNKDQIYKTVTLGILQRFLRLILPFYFCQLNDKAAEMMMTYLCEISENISKKGGVIYEPLHNYQQLHKSNEKQQNRLFYPSLKSKNPNQQQNSQTNKTVYNIHEAESFIKQQIYKGSFIIELIEYIDKAEDILLTIKKQIKINMMNKTQSKSSSRAYLMSAKSVDQLEIDDSDPFGLQRLLNFSKQGKSVTEKDGYSNRQQKFDSLIKALLVLLGDGFMLHIFEE